MRKIIERKQQKKKKKKIKIKLMKKSEGMMSEKYE